MISEYEEALDGKYYFAAFWAQAQSDVCTILLRVIMYRECWRGFGPRDIQRPSQALVFA
jgi:hypothetical protein